MKFDLTMTTRRVVAGAALLLAAGLCQAQYAWIDEKGVRQFSDRPPPTSTPLNKILRQPGGVPDPLAAQTPAQTPSAEDLANKPKGPPTLAERDIDFAKRAKADAESAKKNAEDATRKSDLKENCDAAHAAKTQLESGARISTTDKNGERGYISDAERAQRLQKANKAIGGCQ